MRVFDRLLGRPRPIDLGNLRRLEPVSRVFGQDRGTTIRRHYIERFLEANRAVLRGRILEVGDSRYATRWGAPDSIVDVLDPDPASAAAVHGDLVTGVGVPIERYDAIILTQVLHVLPDMAAAVGHVRAALRPGGTVLASLPGISQVSRYDMDRWGDYWRVTDRGARRLFEGAFAAGDIDVAAYGNVLTAVAALAGLSAEELRPEELDHVDPDYQVLVCVRATR